jgi:hypothetical protein
MIDIMISIIVDLELTVAKTAKLFTVNATVNPQLFAAYDQIEETEKFFTFH